MKPKPCGSGRSSDSKAPQGTSPRSRGINESGFRSSWFVHLKRLSISVARKSSQQVLTQRCPRQIHALLQNQPTHDRCLRDHIPDALLRVEENPLQYLLNDSPKPPGS